MRLEFAPRLSPRLLEALARLDDKSVPIAEICRRVGQRAWELGLPRPSYERVRVLVHMLRRAKRRRGPSTASVLLDISLGIRSPYDILDHVAGVPLRGPP